MTRRRAIDLAAGLPALVVEPDGEADAALLYLHGKAEAGASPEALDQVLAHGSPPQQALDGRLPGAAVIAPQAPPIPNLDQWSWRDHVDAVATFLRERHAGRRIVATGFSRGGLGVLQLVARHPDLVERWAVVDPAAPNDAERAPILAIAGDGRGWVRYGRFRDVTPAVQAFSAALLAAVGGAVCELDHVAVAREAFATPALYLWLGVPVA